MIFAVISVLVGLGVLVVGGEVLLRASVALAQRLKLTPAVIGLTVVAAGTSVPELAVSVLAGISGSTDIAVGNVVGSNIANGSLILGAAAILTPLAVTGNMIRLEYPVMLLVTLLCVVLCDDGVVSRLDAIMFLVSYFLFTVYLISIVRENLQKLEQSQVVGEVTELAISGSARRLWVLLLGLGAGIALLTIGAQFTVSGAVLIGRYAGISERVIGLTIVAVGTSLPEIVTSIVAGFRGRDDVAIGNVIGSNIFNVLVILGLSAGIAPLSVSPELRSVDSYWMLGFALLLFPFMRSGFRLSRVEGVLLVFAYGVYLTFLLTAA